MAIPTIINLKPLKNTYRDGIFTVENKSLVTNIPVDSDTPVTLGAVHKEDFYKIIWQIINNGINPLDVTFYGAALDDDSHGANGPGNIPFSPPPDDTSNEWLLLPFGTVSVLGGENDGRIVTDNWTWIMIKYARTNAGLDALLTLNIRGV